MKQLDRRTLLRGAGVALSLPLLEAMAPVGKTAFATSATPARMMAYYTPCGIRMQLWTPTSFGRDYALSPSLKPLASVKNKVLVLTGLDGRGPMSSYNGGGGHAAGTGAFLTGVQVNKVLGTGAISVDQIAANALGSRTKLDSLVTGIENGTDGESGYDGVFLHNISFVNSTTPKPKIIDPIKVFNAIVSGINDGPTDIYAGRRLAAKKSVLDHVAIDAQKLAARLGSQDKIRVEEYLTNVRGIEMDLETITHDVKGCAPYSPVVGEGRQNLIKIMADLQVLAFECDVTRIQTFMLADGSSYANYGFLPGISGSHHSISHETIDQNIGTINYWQMEMFAYLLQRLSVNRDPSGKSLLDSCAIYYGSEISDGRKHNCNNLPVLLAGGCNGYFATGQHIDVTDVKYTNVLLSMLDAFGVKLDAVGNSTGLLTQGMV